jgi:aspartyl-tRNA(Asn)/glutamyl-tRNA(Gln) amidotransferase subunit A
MVPFATSSDGGGSTRTPAGFTGLVGLKCSYGRIPDLTADRYGQTAVAGALATTVADSARLLDVMAGPHRRDRSSLPAPTVRYEDAIEALDVSGMKAAWSSDLGFAVVDPEVAEIARAAFDALVSAGKLTLDARAIAFADPIPVWAKVGGADTWVHIPDGCWPERAAELDPRVRPGFDSAARVTLPKYGAVLRERLSIEDAMADVFDGVDVLATPMAAIPAFAAEGPMPTEIMGRRVHPGMSVPFAMLANIWGSPAISVPAGVTASGLPVGLHLMADRHREDVCLRLARVLEQARPWPLRAPRA